MAKQYDNTNKASLWTNEGHLDNDNQPVLRGTVNVEGTDYKISLWPNVYFSDDDEVNEEISGLLAEIIELVSEDGGNAPVLRGSVESADESGGRKKSRRSSRRSSGGKASSKRKKAEPEEDATEEEW